jgi:hypothetical protein
MKVVTPENPVGLAASASGQHCGNVCDTCNGCVQNTDTVYSLAVWKEYRNGWVLSWMLCEECWNSDDQDRRGMIEETGLEVIEADYHAKDQKLLNTKRLTESDLED